MEPNRNLSSIGGAAAGGEPIASDEAKTEPPELGSGVVNVADLSYMHDDLAAPLPSVTSSSNQATSPINQSGPSSPSCSSALATAGLTPFDTNGSINNSNPADFPFPKYQQLAAIGEATSPGLSEVPSLLNPRSSSGQGMNVPPLPSHVPLRTAPISGHHSNAASYFDARKPERVNNGPPPVSSNAELLGKRGRSHSSGGKSSDGTKPTMLSAIGGQKSANFIRNMFHKEDKVEKAERMASKERSRSSVGREPSSQNLSLDVSPRGSPNPNGDASPYSNHSPPATPGSPNYNDSAFSSANPSRAPSRATSVRRPTGEGFDPNSQQVNPNLLADKLAAASFHKNQSSTSIASPSGGDANNSHKFNLKDLLNSGPKLARRPSASSAASKSEKAVTAKSDKAGKSDKGGSEKGGIDGVSTASLLAKYGVCEKAAIGKGATAVVRLAHKWDRREEKLYAVKEFRKRRKNETEKDYVKKLTSEFCISSTLHHTNIVETVDLVQDESHHWCEVMEYCPGGDLYAAIKKGNMSQGECDGYFKQLLEGVQYLHSMGVAHRDIKPENLLLDGRGHVKITDFGVSDVFRMCWEKKTHLSKGLCGSEPYIAPEQFEQKEYDARLVDVWACGIVYYCMQLQELPWGFARRSDKTFSTYLSVYASSLPSSTSSSFSNNLPPTPPALSPGLSEGGPPTPAPSAQPFSHGNSIPAPISNLPREGRALLKRMLDPDPKTRWGVEECLKEKWMVGLNSGSKPTVEAKV